MPVGYKHTKEAKRKIGESSLKRHQKKDFGFLKGNHPKTEFKKGRISNRKGAKHTEEAKEKNRQAHLGEKHPCWIKDRNLLKKKQLRYDSAYQEWVKQIKKRDSWKCRINNKDCSGSLEIHHILSWKDFPELRYNINNGITLCQVHHPRKRAEEKRLIPFLSGLVSVSNEIF